MLFFRDWLDAEEMSAVEYARAAGIHANTVYRRRRGELRTPAEVRYLLEELARVRRELAALKAD